MAVSALKLNERDQVALFCALSLVQTEESQEPWTPVSFEKVYSYVAGDIEALADGESVEDFFNHYRREHKIETLAHLKDYFRKNRCEKYKNDVEEAGNTLTVTSRTTARLMKRPFYMEHEKLVTELGSILQHVSRETLFHPLLWKYFGGYKRISYVNFVTSVGHALSMCSLEESNRLRTGTTPSCRHDMEKIVQSEVETLKSHFGHYHETQAESEDNLQSISSDIRTLLNYISFQTVASEDCFHYLRVPLRLIPKMENGNLERVRLEYIKLIAEVLEHVDMVTMRKSQFWVPGDALQNLIMRKREMAYVRQHFSDSFDRYMAYHSRKANNKRVALIAIFHGVHFHMATVDKYPLTRIISYLMQETVICRSATDCLSWKNMFLDALFSEDCNNMYFVTTNQVMKLVKEYVYCHVCKFV